MPSVLVIDDDDDIRGVIAFKLRRAGYEVHEEADGDAGLAAALQERPDMILADWMMPRLSGVELCRTLRANEELRTTPILLLTAKAQEADVERGFAAGADDYVVKPFSPRELISRVQARVGAA